VIFYRIVRTIVLALCRVLFRVKVYGLEHVPSSGSYIIAPTHRSLLDIPFAAFTTKRRIRFMAKEELFTKPWLAKILTALGGFPVSRGTADRAAAAIQELLGGVGCAD
jgi:1-acyl-sn-glycerol-3-phosphate acyltransferase